MDADVQPCVSRFKYSEVSTKEGGEKEVKEVKITTSEPFLLYMDKNVLVVTPLK